ncbi:SixA phosphatase family protein [Ramlibacter sp. AN1133]|uniref:SixA phosphatase family protein n=1 Tax=Ramlibacter sp. AN1133 TaxID=3133429 RepID=UPI0030BEB495
MDLILWRHAEAEDARDGLPDLERELTKKGEKQAAKVGAWLDRELPHGTLVLCSPAVRCEQTVRALQRKYQVREALRPGATAQDVLKEADWPSGKQPVLVVGHQPVLGQVVAQLLRIEGGECTVRKGGAWWLRRREEDGAEQTFVWAVQSPETA